MNDAFPYTDIIVLALIAAFVLLRLRAVLGQKIGHEAPPLPDLSSNDQSAPMLQPTDIARPMPAIDVDEALMKNLSQDIAAAIMAIKKADPQFTLTSFLEGARTAYEMVFDAFRKDDTATLKMLLSPTLYETFSAELDRRRNAEARLDTTLVAMTSEDVIGASLDRQLAHIRVRFMSEQVAVQRDRTNKIVEGDPSHSELVQDEWVFERDVTSRNPNWKIIET